MSSSRVGHIARTDNFAFVPWWRLHAKYDCLRSVSAATTNKPIIITLKSKCTWNQRMGATNNTDFPRGKLKTERRNQWNWGAERTAQLNMMNTPLWPTNTQHISSTDHYYYWIEWKILTFIKKNNIYWCRFVLPFEFSQLQTNPSKWDY